MYLHIDYQNLLNRFKEEKNTNKKIMMKWIFIDKLVIVGEHFSINDMSCVQALYLIRP